MKTKKKILVGTFDTPRKSLGGPGKFVPMFYRDLYTLLHENCVDIEVYALFNSKIIDNPEDIVYKEPLASRNYVKEKLINFVKKNPSIYFLLKGVKEKILLKEDELLRNLKKMYFNVINLHDFYSVYYLQNIDVPIIFTNHYKGSLYKEYIQYLPNMNKVEYENYYTNIEREAIKRADVLVFPSISAKNLLLQDFQDLKSLIESKSEIIYTGINDCKNENDINLNSNIRKAKLVLNVSNHIPDKGIDLSIKIFKKLLELNPNLTFVNIGSFGPETMKLRFLTKDLGIENKVIFMGVLNHEDVLNYMKKSFLLLHTPRRTVFDLVILEAMSLGVPIIATSVLGLIEALGEEYVLYINETGEFKFSIDILENENLIKEIKVYLRNRFIEKFTVKQMLSNYLSLYYKFL